MDYCITSSTVYSRHRYTCSGMCTSVRGPESARLLRKEAPRKSGPGGSRDDVKPLASRLDFALRHGISISRLLNASVISTLLYGCESCKLAAQARRKLNGTASKMLSRITGRTIADEAREPTLDVMMRAGGRRWNWLGHILRLEEHRVIRPVLMNCVRPTQESLFGDVPDLQ